jgi:surface polysaccharide O-acyltransferase-like enzyme
MFAIVVFHWFLHQGPDRNLPYRLLPGFISPVPYYGRWLLVGLFFVSLGYWMARRPRGSGRIGLGLFAAGYALKLLEAFIYPKVTVGLSGIDYYTLATPLMGAGFFLLALSRPRQKIFALLAAPASLTLGIYAAHIYVTNELFRYGVFWHPFPRLIGPFVVYTASLVLVWLLSRGRFLSRFVS